MNWGSVGAFLDMGGYGLYVWGSYGVTLIVVAVEMTLAHQRLRQARRRVAANDELES